MAAAPAELEPDLRRRLAGLQIELEAFEQLELAALPGGRPVAGEETNPSMLKLVGSELHQKVAGPYAAAALSALGVDEALDAGARAMAKHLSVRAASIYSGSSETQRNVIAGRMLAG
jgi:acyl-CoA dehydrogenase